MCVGLGEGSTGLNLAHQVALHHSYGLWGQQFEHHCATGIEERNSWKKGKALRQHQQVIY